MGTWTVSTDGENGDYKPGIPKPGLWVAFEEFVYYEGLLGPIVLYNYASAKGRIDKSKKQRQNGYKIRVKGEYKDALVVIERLESYFEPVDLNNPYYFPKLPSWVDRLRYIILGVPKQKKK